MGDTMRDVHHLLERAGHEVVALRHQLRLRSRDQINRPWRPRDAYLGDVACDSDRDRVSRAGPPAGALRSPVRPIIIRRNERGREGCVREIGKRWE